MKYISTIVSLNVIPIGVSSFLSLVVMIPLLKLGYIQTLDMPWGPIASSGSSDVNYHVLFSVFGIFPSMLVQKVLLLAIPFVATLGAYKLASAQTKFNHPYVAFVVAALYLFNPFFYTRLMAGQWLVLLGYALLPWAVLSIWKFLQAPTWRTAWPTVLWTAAIGLTSIHTIGFVALAAIVLTVAAGRANLKAKAKWAGVIIGLWVAVNAIWLVPLVLGDSQTSQNIASFSTSEMRAFATQGTMANSVPLSAALLTGFWADSQNRYILPSSLPIWWVGVAIIGVLVIAGAVATIRRRDRFGIALGVLGIIGWFLAMGIAWGGSAWFTNLLIQVFPYYNGYREPQKWLMLLALAYAYLAAVGADALYGRLKRTGWTKTASLIIPVALLAPFLFAPTLAWGAAGQLKSAEYPAGWYATKTYLDSKPEATVLVLPWHVYLPISFTGRVVANPTPYFFSQNMITGDNFELRGVPPQNPTALTQYVSNRLVPLDSEHINVGASLQQKDVQYVMLLKETDWQSYGWLNGQADLPIVQDNQNIRLYEVRP